MSSNQFEHFEETSSTSDQSSFILIKRPVFKQIDFDNQFLIKQDSEKIEKRNFFSKILKFFELKKFLSFFTILNLISEYDFGKNLIADLLSGLTVGVMNIPAVGFFKSFIKTIYLHSWHIHCPYYSSNINSQVEYCTYY